VVKDVVAMANSGGGVILFGIDDRGEAVRDPVELFSVDPAEITKRIHKYTEEHFDSFEICKTEKGGPLLRSWSVGSTSRWYSRSRGPFRTGRVRRLLSGRATVYFRHGAQSAPGGSADLRDAIERMRHKWARNIRRVIEAPAGSMVEVVPAVATADDSRPAVPIRMTEDPEAVPYRIADPDQTHPFRTMEIVAEINATLPPESRVNVHDIRAIRAAHDLDQRRDMIHNPRHGPRQFSPLFADRVRE
jgi:hypothetical protein